MLQGVIEANGRVRVDGAPPYDERWLVGAGNRLIAVKSPGGVHTEFDGQVSSASTIVVYEVSRLTPDIAGAGSYRVSAQVRMSFMPGIEAAPERAVKNLAGMLSTRGTAMS